VVVFSERGLSTPSVYAAFDLLNPEPPEPRVPDVLLQALAAGDVETLGMVLANDLESPAFDLRPDLEQTAVHGLEAGAVTDLLSGSGPTMLFLCRDAAHARDVARGLFERGHDRLSVVPAPVAGAHVLSYA
jgi:4-diphosphocytidyl-2-C-methyl-D-erythritol kinase